MQVPIVLPLFIRGFHNRFFAACTGIINKNVYSLEFLLYFIDKMMDLCSLVSVDVLLYTKLGLCERQPRLVVDSLSTTSLLDLNPEFPEVP